jgi:cysteine desulfurase
MKKDKTIYLDHQATTPLDPQVLDAMRPHLGSIIGNPHSTDHSVGWRAARAVDSAAEDVARLIGCDRDEVIFTSGATEANNLAVLGLARRATNGKKRRVLLSAIEHKSILALGRVLRDQLGLTVGLLPVDHEGRVRLDVLADELNDDVMLVSIMAVNNEIGTIQRIPEIYELVSQHGALLHCDGAQAPLAMNLEEISSHVDLLSLSGHKMHGPMGIGALYVRRDIQGRIEPLIYGGGQQNGLRSGTLPTALCVGLGAAARCAGGPQASRDRADVRRVRDMLVERLKDLPCSVWINGPADSELRHPGNINICFDGIEAADLLSRVQPRLAASTGSACASGIPEPSHVLRSIGLSDAAASSCIRFSLGRNTKDQDIEECTDILRSALLDICAMA